MPLPRVVVLAAALSATIALSACESLDDEDMGLLMGMAMVTTAVAADPSGEAANSMLDSMAQGMGPTGMVSPAMGMPAAGGGAGAAAMLGQTMAAPGVTSGPAQVAMAGRGAGGSYPARPNTLAGSSACAGYTVENYKEYYAANASGPDAQLHALCAGAYNYYWMYLNAIRQGYSQADSDRTYAAFQDAAAVAENFYATAR